MPCGTTAWTACPWREPAQRLSSGSMATERENARSFTPSDPGRTSGKCAQSACACASTGRRVQISGAGYVRLRYR